MVFGTSAAGKAKRCKVCYKQKCECGGASAARAPAPAARSRAESQSALDADIAMIETTPRSNKAPRAKNNKARYTDPGADNIPGNPNACNPDREPTDSGFAQNDRVVHGTRGVGTVLGFFGEFVCVQYDTGPVGQHKYTWPKARKVLDFSTKAGGPPAEAPPPAENVSCCAPSSGSMNVITAANGVEICADCMARVALCKCSFATKEAAPKLLGDFGDKPELPNHSASEITCTKRGPAQLPTATLAAKPVAGRCEECFRKVCICDKEEPSPSPIRAKPASKASTKAPESYNQNGSDILGIGGGDDDEEDMEREETDSGFAQWDRVKHTKRGLGRCIGFFGEFVMIQFDDEPQGRHKYTWDQAKRKVTIVGWEPPNKQA